jgi:4'-phosphopantetheinyl transferase
VSTLPADRAGPGLPAVTTVPTGGGAGPVLVAVEPAVAPAGEPDPAALRALSAAARRRLAGMAPDRAAEFLRGRWLLRRLAGAVLGLPPQRVPLTTGQRGALRLAGSPVGVSLSHSARHTAAACWPAGPVGVDVEDPAESVDPRLVRRCCGPWADVVAGLSPRRRAAAFVRTWTAQEACVKAAGTGLAGAPWRIPVDPRAPTGRWRHYRWYAIDTVAPTALAVAVPAPAHTSEEKT